jgi:hypothetical protein
LQRRPTCHPPRAPAVPRMGRVTARCCATAPLATARCRARQGAVPASSPSMFPHHLFKPSPPLRQPFSPFLPPPPGAPAATSASPLTAALRPIAATIMCALPSPPSSSAAGPHRRHLRPPEQVLPRVAVISAASSAPHHRRPAPVRLCRPRCCPALSSCSTHAFPTGVGAPGQRCCRPPLATTGALRAMTAPCAPRQCLGRAHRPRPSWATWPLSSRPTGRIQPSSQLFFYLFANSFKSQKIAPNSKIYENL